VFKILVAELLRLPRRTSWTSSLQHRHCCKRRGGSTFLMRSVWKSFSNDHVYLSWPFQGLVLWDTDGWDLLHYPGWASSNPHPRLTAQTVVHPVKDPIGSVVQTFKAIGTTRGRARRRSELGAPRSVFHYAADKEREMFACPYVRCHIAALDHLLILNRHSFTGGISDC
jgi:hypothetical protein